MKTSLFGAINQGKNALRDFAAVLAVANTHAQEGLAMPSLRRPEHLAAAPLKPTVLVCNDAINGAGQFHRARVLVPKRQIFLFSSELPARLD
jgi:hypothetical protein